MTCCQAEIRNCVAILCSNDHQLHNDKNNILQYVLYLCKYATKAEKIPLVEEDSEWSQEVAVAAKAFDK